MACFRRGLHVVLAQLCLSVLLGVPLDAKDVTIDFEHYPGPDGRLGTADDIPTPTTCQPEPCNGPVGLLTTQYSAVGITFSQGTLFYAPSLWPGHQHFISSTPPVATLSRPARQVSITSYSYWNATLTAYDASGNVIGTFVLTHPSPGDYPFLGMLSVYTMEPIARFSVLPDEPGQILNLDDLQYGSALDFFTLTPCRLLDTRDAAGTFGGPALEPGIDRVFPLFGRCGIPPTARAVSVNLTVTQPTAAGSLRLYPAGVALPLASSINYTPGVTRANNAVVGLSPTGELAVRCTQAAGTTHFILDVNGYFE